MFVRILIGAIILAIVAAGVGLFLTRPQTLPASEIVANYKPDIANGQVVFTAGNCSACHMTPGQDDRTQLAGGAP